MRKIKILKTSYFAAACNELAGLASELLAWPGDSEETAWSSSQAATCPSHSVEASLSLLLLNVKPGSCEYQFYSIWLTRPGFVPGFIESVAVTLSQAH